MAVSTYNNNNCRYRLDKLDKVVYLISEEATKNIRIDNGEAFVSGITQQPLSLEVYNISLSDTDELDERYKFTHTLTFSMNGYANYNYFNGRYYAIVKTMDGEYWLVNPLFPCKVTYTYTLDASGSHTDFTMATISNHPTLRIHGIEHATPYTCKGYRYCHFKSLKLNEKKYSIKSGNNVKYTNDGFKEIMFNKNSASLIEQFDGKNVQHSIQFNIKFDDYKSSWHYNLLEFINNKYAAIVETSCNKTILTGFNFGLQPSFIVNSNSDITLDNIQINLVDIHDNGSFIEYDAVDVVPDEDSNYIFTTEHHGYECIGINTARFLLKKEVDAFGNPTGNYMCLEGYESQFSDLNIVGTFSTTEEFANSECGGHECGLQTSMPNAIVLNTIGSKTYSLIADTDWSISSSANHITVSPLNGLANTPYTVTVTNSLQPTSSATQSTLTIAYCSKTKTFDVSVEKGNSCFSAGATFDISANGQYVTVPTVCCVQTVTESSSTITNISIQSSYIRVYVPQNNTGAARTFILTVIFCNGTIGEITINQSTGFERWVKEDTACTGNMKCDVERKYTGTTASDINTRTNETRLTNCAISQDCGSVLYRWIDTSETTCNNGRKYIVQIEQISTDGGSTWSNTSNKRLGNETPDSPAECSGSPTYNKWVVLSGANDYWCDDTTKWQKEQLYISSDNINWTPTNVYRKGEVAIEYNSVDCGYDPNPHLYFEWVESGTTCNGYDKYTNYVKLVSDDGNTWSATTVTKMDYPMTGNSVDCGYVPPIIYEYQWILTSATTCVGYDKYYLYKQQRRVSGTSTWEDVIPTTTSYNGNGTQTPSIAEADSSDCGYVPPVTPIYDYRLMDIATDWICDTCPNGIMPLYKWSDSEEIVCIGDDKYSVKKYQVSYDYGNTWADVEPEVLQKTLIKRYSSDCMQTQNN